MAELNDVAYFAGVALIGGGISLLFNRGFDVVLRRSKPSPPKPDWHVLIVDPDGVPIRSELLRADEVGNLITVLNLRRRA